MKTLIVLIRNIVAGLENCSLKQKDDIIQFFAPSSYSQPPPTPWSIQVLHPDPAGDEGGSAPLQLSPCSSPALAGQQCLLLETTRQQNPWNCCCSAVKVSLANPHTNTTHSIGVETNTALPQTMDRTSWVLKSALFKELGSSKEKLSNFPWPDLRTTHDLHALTWILEPVLWLQSPAHTSLGEGNPNSPSEGTNI